MAGVDPVAGLDPVAGNVGSSAGSSTGKSRWSLIVMSPAEIPVVR